MQFALAQTTQFQRIIGGKGNEQSYSVMQTRDGGYILTGYTDGNGSGGDDVFLTKTDGLGKVLWSKAYGTKGDEAGWKVKQTSDSGYIVGGTISTNKGDGLLFKTKEDGSVVWSIAINSDSAEDIYNVLESRFTGDIYVTGYLKTLDTLGTDAFIAKFSSSGNFIWQRRIGGAGDEEAYAIVEESANYIAVVGKVVDDTVTIGGILGAPGDEDFFISRFNSKGSMQWTRNFGSANKEQMWDIKYDKGVYIVSGWANTGPGIDEALIAFIDTNAKILNSYSYNTVGASTRAFSVIVNPDDTYSLTGYSTNGLNRDAFYLNTNKSGVVNAFNLIGGASRDGHWPSEVTRTIDGGFTILTTSNSFKSSNANDLYLIRTDSKGASFCNSSTPLVTNFGYNLSSGIFARVGFGANNQKISLTTTSISSFDSVLCCKLQAQVAAKTLRVCTGEGARLGKPAIPGYVYKWTQVGGSFTSTDASPLVFPTGSASYKLVVKSSDGKCVSDSATISVSLKTDLKNRNFVRDTFFCAGDTVQVTARSGMIDYFWKGKKNSFNGRTVKFHVADTIILTVTDTTTCKYNDTMKVLLKKLPAFNLGNDTTICDNTKITLSGPANMKTYSWNGGQGKNRTFITSEEKTHNLAVVDSFGCKFSDTKVIFNNPSSSFSLGRDTTICKGINYTIFGPGFLSNFYWNGISSFSANKVINDGGTYILQASNTFGCIHIDTVVIGLKQNPTFSLGPDGGVCASGGRRLKGPSKMTGYRWDDGSTDSTYDVFKDGTYWLRVTGANGCIFTDSIKLVKVNNPKPELGNDTTICEKDSIFLDAGVYAGYKWNTGATSRLLKVKYPGGLYEVTVTDNNGCAGIDDKSVKTKFCLGNISKLMKVPGLKVSPNPAKDQLNIEWLVKYTDASISMFDVNGKMVYEHKANPGFNSFNVNVSEFPRGIYYLKVSTGNTGEALKVILD
jgi:hypothetical protein